MIKNKIEQTRECYAEAFSIPKDVALNTAIIHIIGKTEIIIENYKGIVSYTTKEIIVKGNSNKIYILGDGLQIEYYCGDDMKVKGRISDVKID